MKPSFEALNYKIFQSEFKLYQAESKIAETNHNLKSTKIELADRVKACSDLTQRVQQEVQKRHKIRNSR